MVQLPTDGSRTAGPQALLASMVDYLGMLVALIALILVFSRLSDTFFSAGVFYTIANEVPDTVIVAVGMTFVLIIAGIDLSVGSVLGLSQAVLGYCLVRMGLPLPVAIGGCLLAGLACGALNGLVINLWVLPSFIVTLGMLEVARGTTFLVTDYRTFYLSNTLAGLTDTIPGCGDLTWPVLICIATVVAGQFVLSRTVFGRYMIAVGTNEEAVRLAGINPKPIKFAVFTLCGLLGGLAGLIRAARMSSANPNAGTGFELEVIAAVVIGGTSLMGGRGSVVKSCLGVLIVAVLGAGLVQCQAPEYAKRVIIGAVIVLAVILDRYRRRKLY
ncbi:MAG: ABC transporter permease [Phycisphaerae bacterium]|nr:ABC transporter permease [Phycisphaerae bacterium]